MFLFFRKAATWSATAHPQEFPAPRSIEACFDDFVRQFFRARKHHLVAAVHFKQFEFSKT
jgi:hypothetical protein